MAKKSVMLKLGGQTFKLRLTMHGLRQIRSQYPDDEPLSTLMSAVTDLDKLCAVLEQCLNWDDEVQNPITDAEEFYDLLVDSGHGGQEGLSDLMIDLAIYSGLMAAEDGSKMKVTMKKTIRNAYENLDAEAASLTGTAELDGNPTPEP